MAGALVAGADVAGADEAGADEAGALVAGADVVGADVAGALDAGLEEAGTDAGALDGKVVAGLLDWVTGKEVVETTVERAGQLTTSGPQLVTVTSLVDITIETGGAAGAELTGELLDAGIAGAAGAVVAGPAGA